MLDLQLGNGAAAPDFVHLSAVNGNIEVKAADAPWTNPANGILEVGLFIPSGVAGPVTIAAVGMKGNLVVVEGALAQPVTLKVGGSVGPFAIVLAPSVPVPTGYDGGLDAGASEAGASDAGTSDGVAPDGGAPDAKILDAGEHDGPVQLDVGSAEVLATDSPLSSDGAEASPPDNPGLALDASDLPLDGPANATDTSGVSEAGHVPGWEPAQNIQNDSTSTTVHPVVVVEPVTENVYAAWAEDASVKVRRWGRTSGTWERTVVVENRGSPQDAAIGADAKGNIILVWCQSPNSTDVNLAGTWASRTSDGVAWSPPVRIGALPTWGVQLAVARNGTARAVYPKKVPDQKWPLFSAYYDGTSWTENPQIIEAELDYWDQSPRLVVSSTGDGILIFNRFAESGDNRIGAVTLTGQTFSAPTTMNVNSATTSYGDRAIAMNRKGEAVFVWSEGDNSTMGLYARTYSPSLGWSSTPPAITSSNSLFAIATTLDEQENVTIVWQQYIAAGYMNLMGIHGSPSGAWSNTTVLETDNLASYLVDAYAFPAMAIDGNGNSLVVWRKDRSTSTTTTYGVYASRFAGGTWLPQFQLGQKTGLDVVEMSLSVSDQGLGAAAFAYLSDSPTTDVDAYQAMVAFFR